MGSFNLFLSKLVQRLSQVIILLRDPRTDKLVRADQAIRSGPRTGPDADQQNFWKSGPERTTDQGKFENADRGGPRTSVIKNRGPRKLE